MKRTYNVKSVHRYQRMGNGSHEHCCVPLCSNSSRYNSVLSFHRFPKDPELRLKWLDRIRRDCLTVTSHIKVCSRHFSRDKLIVTSQGRRTLKFGAVPTLFHWNNYAESETRFGVWELPVRPRTPPAVQSDTTDPDPEEPADTVQPTQQTEEDMVPVVVDHEYCFSSKSVVVDRVHYDGMLREIDALDPGQSRLQDPCGLQRFAGSPQDILFYTRFPSYDHLMAFWTLMEPATSRMVRTTRAKGSSAEREEAFSRHTQKLAPVDEFFLFLNFLSTGCTQRELGHRFNIQTTTVSRIIITWADFLYRLLGSVCTWLTPEQIRAHLPPEFREYADTQVIIDCTELRCQAPSSPLHQNDVFSLYKSHCTFKAMVGMAPHGALTFVSALYDSSVSDKEMFRQSGIVPLLSPNRAVMVDKDFLVDDLVPGKVHRPAFLSKGNQTSAHDGLETRLRVHVERLTRRVKENKLFDTEIPSSISGSITQLFTVACLLSNYQNAPLLKK
ncbi:uncharacterized protein LOC141783628 isoform X1 [Sebastes fasciatus]|uniref:uncharacterized protein LOC141783628 isoform X1 n=1 Tax=Sebastes fasciatus TaxID=394691 RepID=UPI003D9EA43A